MRVLTHRAVKLREKVLEWPNKPGDNVPLPPASQLLAGIKQPFILVSRWTRHRARAKKRLAN